MANHNDQPKGFFGGLMMGALLGGIVALLFGTNEEGETIKPVKNRVKKAKVTLKGGRDWVQDKAQDFKEDVGGSVTESRERLLAKVEEIKDRFGGVDLNKYTRAVSEVVKEMKGLGKITTAQTQELKHFLMEDFKKITKGTKKK